VAGGRELVEAVVAAEHQRRGSARLEDARDQRNAVEARDPDGVGLGASGVAERPEEVEDGRHAEFRSRRPRVTEAGVERGREGEGDARLGEHLGDPLRRQRQIDAERPSTSEEPEANWPRGCRA
jgi:hypothetical protein